MKCVIDLKVAQNNVSPHFTDGNCVITCPHLVSCKEMKIRNFSQYNMTCITCSCFQSFILKLFKTDYSINQIMFNYDYLWQILI